MSNCFASLISTGRFHNFNWQRFVFFATCGALLFAGVWRYVTLPSFWLDEAFVALKDFSIQKVLPNWNAGSIFRVSIQQ